MGHVAIVEVRQDPAILEAAREALNAPCAGLTHRATISVAMPVYNEVETIREIVRRVQVVDRELEILIVDDGSNDGTREILEELARDKTVRVFLQERNQGKGAALRRAFEEASNDIVIVQDADLEYDPAHYDDLVKPIEEGRADVVYGSRYLPGPRVVPPFWHTQVNRFLTTLSNALNDLCLTDMETCYKVFRREVIQSIALVSNRFGFEPEITAKLARLGCVIYEVPIRYDRRSYATGKKITWRDGVAALWHILRFSLSRRPVCKESPIPR